MASLFIYFRIQQDIEEYKKSFDDELTAFKQRIKRRAAEKMEILVKEAEEEERQKRLGPGGLDPVEVFESLPQVSIQKYTFPLRSDNYRIRIRARGKQFNTLYSGFSDILIAVLFY